MNFIYNRLRLEELEITSYLPFKRIYLTRPQHRLRFELWSLLNKMIDKSKIKFYIKPGQFFFIINL